MDDRMSMFRVARLSIYPPVRDGGSARWALLANTVRRGIPHGAILADGVVEGSPSFPSQEELVELFDSALRQQRLL